MTAKQQLTGPIRLCVYHTQDSEIFTVCAEAQIANVESDAVRRGIAVQGGTVDDGAEVDFSQRAAGVGPGDRIDRVKVHNPRWKIIRVRRRNRDEQLRSRRVGRKQRGEVVRAVGHDRRVVRRDQHVLVLRQDIT